MGNFIGMKHVWSPLVYMQFIIACDLLRHCLEAVRLIQISLSSFNPLERDTEGGGVWQILMIKEAYIQS